MTLQALMNYLQKKWFVTLQYDALIGYCGVLKGLVLVFARTVPGKNTVDYLECYGGNCNFGLEFNGYKNSEITAILDDAYQTMSKVIAVETHKMENEQKIDKK